MNKHKTEQEKFWAGEFGTDYIERNRNQRLFAGKVALLSKVLSKVNNIESGLEFGANIGLNLQALKILLPKIDLSAIEINPEAVEELKKLEIKKIYSQSILEFFTKEKYDLVFSMGVLIHIDPTQLNLVYEKMHLHSKKYILLAEYYNPTPVELNYHGHMGKLFKRDFAGEIMDQYDDLELFDYGFVYHRDCNFPLDDLNWFLLKKK